MPRKGRIARLPTEIRSALDRLIRDGQLTIDEMVEELQERGADVPRSTLGAYKKRMEEQLQHYREAQEVAGAWVAELGQQKDSQLGQLLAEMLKTIAFQTMAAADEVDPKDLHFVARALKDLAGAEKLTLELRTKLRDTWEAEMQARAAAAEEQVREVARTEGLTEDAAARLREIVLGVVG